MPDLSLRVCGITIRVSMDDDDLARQGRARYAPFLHNGTPDLRFAINVVGRRLRKPAEEPRIRHAGRRVHLERHDLDIELTSRGGRGRMLRNISSLDSLLRIALSFELVRRGGFLCHSASIDGRLFPGVSGAGKSTLGLSAPSTRLLADEHTGVLGTRLHGTPFWGDFRAGKNNISRRLEGIFFLNRKGPRGVHPISKGEAVARLLECVLFFGDDLASGRRILQLARDRVVRVPTFLLSYDARTTSFRKVERMLSAALRRESAARRRR